LHWDQWDEKDHPVFNFRYRGTWIAHGAIIENIKIASSHYELSTSINYFPDQNQPNLTARIEFFTSKEKSEDPLFRYIERRATNRKKYSIQPLKQIYKQKIQASCKEMPGKLIFVENRSEIDSLADVASVGEIINLENKKLHKLFFEEIVWNQKEEFLKKSGLYVKTMELPCPQIFAMKLAQFWPIMKVLNLFKVARKIAKDNAKTYAATPVFGAILVKNNDLDFLHAGRMLERIWLTATMLGLDLHLTTSTLFLWQKQELGNSDIFESEHSIIISRAYKNTLKILGGSPDQIVALLFRLGVGGEPAARSSKKEPAIIKK